MACFSPALPLIGGGHTKFQPIIYVSDVAEAVMAALGHESAYGKTYEIGGPSYQLVVCLYKGPSLAAFIAADGYLPANAKATALFADLT